MYTFGPKTGYEAWKEEQEKFEKLKRARKKAGVSEPSASQSRPIEYVNKNYEGNSSEGSYKWESEFLKSLPIKQFGRSYNDKFNNSMKALGASPSEAANFRTWMDATEDKVNTKKSLTDNIIKSAIQKQNANFDRLKKYGQNTSNSSEKLEPFTKISKAQQEKKKKSEDGGLEKFAKGFVRGTGNLIDAVVPFTDPVKDGFMKDVNNHKLLSKDARDWLNDAFKPAKSTGQKVADAANEIGSTFLPVGALYKAADKTVDALQGVPKLARQLEKMSTKKKPEYLKEAQKGLLASTSWGAQNEVNRWTSGEENSVQDSLRNVAIESAIGAAADPAVVKLGQLLKNLKKPVQEAILKSKKPSLEQLLSDIKRGSTPKSNDLYDRLTQKGLTPPKMSTSDRVKNDPFLGFGQQTSTLPKARFQKPDFRALEDTNAPGGRRPVGYWKKRYEEFAKYVNDNYENNNLTQEGLDDLWSQFAKYDENVTLDQVADLYQKDFKRVNEDLRKQLPFGQTSIPQARTTLLPNLSNQQINTIPKGLDALKNMSKPSTPDLSKFDDFLKKIPKNNVEHPQQLLNPFDALRKKPTQKPLVDPLFNFKKSEQVTKEPNLRGFIDTLQNSKKSSDQLLGDLQDKYYEPISNKTTVQQANNRINKGIEDAVSFINGADKFTAEHVATGLRLIDDLQKNGDVGRAVDVAELLAKKGTEAGQAVQAFSIYDRLSPQGILIHANRIADRTNQRLSRFNDKVKIDNETANNLTDLASSIRSMTDQKTVANDVIGLMDKAKKGTQLNDDELKSVARFVNDAKQFIGDITPKGKPKPPKPIQNKEIRTKVINFLDSQEAAARKRIDERRNRVNSLPVDVFYDYAVIGASKIAKGTVNLTDFADDMIREFGDEVKPYVEQVYRKAVQMIDTQAGRTINTRLSDIEKITNSALKTAKISEQEATGIRDFAQKIGKMSGDMKDEASMNLQATLQLLERPTLLQQVSTVQTIAQLLNPKTIIRNAIGNELFYRTERINKMVATPIDWARSKVTGGQRTVTFSTNNQGEYWKNWMKGAKAGWKGVNPDGLQTRYDLHGNSFRGKWNPLTYMEKTLGATLQSFDYAGYKRAVNHTLGELATLRATNEGLKGQAKKEAIERYIRETDENALAIANEYGKYVTFQDNNNIAVGLQKFKRFLNADKDWGFGDLIIKYPKTPGALIARSLEYSPAGFLRSFYTIGNSIRKGEKVNVKDVTESVTRALIGTGGITGVAWFLADKGILSGTGGTDWDIQELEKMAGKMEYSLNITALKRWVTNSFDEESAEARKGDTYVSYNWAQPIAISMSLGANLQQMQQEPGKTNYARNAYNLVGGAFDTMIDQSVLSGLKDAFQLYPGQSVTDKAVDIAGNVPSSFVPTAFNQTRQLMDNTTRNTYDPNKFKEYLNRAQNRVPGYEKELPPGYDTLGNQKEVYQGGTNNIFNVLLNPAFVRKYNPTPEAEMVLNVLNDTGDSAVAPRRAAKYLKIDGVRYDLTPEQYSDYQRRLGEATREGLADLMSSGSQDPDEIYKMLNKVGKQVRDQLKEEVK